jgi:hypothetical protein
MVHSVSFISIKQEQDLILSFAIVEDSSEDILSLTLLRTPKYETDLLPGGRGISVSWEVDEDIHEMVQAVERSKKKVKLNTTKREYLLDISRIPNKDIQGMGKVLQEMNFDKAIKLKGFQ